MKTVSVEFWTKVRVKRIIQVTDEAANMLNGIAVAGDDGFKYIEEAYLPNKKLPMAEYPSHYEKTFMVLNTVPFFDEILERSNYLEQISIKEVNHE